MKNIFKNKNVLVVGLKKSGKSSLEILFKLDAICYAYDDDKEVLKQFATLNKYNLITQLDEDIIKIMDYMVISPSVSINSEWVKLAKLYGIKVLGELELASLFAKGKIISITGSNGKTTTCSLIYHILKSSANHCILCGNIGEPFTENLLPYKTNYCVETSSFQLESIDKFKPNIAGILNITPNHLDRHLTFEKYAEAKYNIFKNMKFGDTLFLNYDDKNLRKLADAKIKPKVVWVSAEKEVDGYFVKNEKVYFKHKRKVNFIADILQRKLVGSHNLCNILFAVAVCKKLKVKNKDIEKAINTFVPLKHRLQFVKNVNGVDYVNDSKSTSPDSTIKAIDAYHKKPLILLLGGSDKDTSFDRLAKKIKLNTNIKLVVVSGDTSKKIIKSFSKIGYKNFYKANSFADGLEYATNQSASGDTILLSPACASFDYFKSFVERGDAFIDYVNKIK